KAAPLGGHELDGARPADARVVIASNLALDRPDDFGALAVGKVGVCEIVFGQDFGDLRIHRVDIALAVLPVELAERDGHLGSSLRLTRGNICALGYLVHIKCIALQFLSWHGTLCSSQLVCTKIDE